MSPSRSLFALAIGLGLSLAGCVGDAVDDLPMGTLTPLAAGTGLNGSEPDCVGPRLNEIIVTATQYPIAASGTNNLNPDWNTIANANLGEEECVMQNVAWAGMGQGSSVVLPILDPSTGAPEVVSGTGLFVLDLKTTTLTPPATGALGSQDDYIAAFLELIVAKWNKGYKVPIKVVSPFVQQNAPQTYLDQFKLLEGVFAIKKTNPLSWDGFEIHAFVNSKVTEICPSFLQYFEMRLCHDWNQGCRMILHRSEEFSDYCRGDFGGGNATCFGFPVLESYLQESSLPDMCSE
ncbi:MAG: hypothetical protein QM820_45275 [Minicystis sp.]